MNLPPVSQRRAAQIAGLVAVVAFLLLVERYYHPVYGFTALIQLDEASDRTKLGAFHELPIYVHAGSGRYDGQYYAQIAHHPALDAPELHQAIDNLSYRARRMLPATLAWFLAAGQKAWITPVYAALNILAWLGLAVLLWRGLDVGDLRGWLAWAGVMFSAGALGSVRLALTDLIALAFVAAAMFALDRGRPARGSLAFAAGSLTRETAILAVIGAWDRPWLSWRNARLALAAWAPLGLWMLYVLWRVGPANQGLANLTLPVIGFVEKWIEAVHALGLFADWPLTGSTLLCTAGLTVQAAFFFLRRETGSRWWRLGAAYAVLMFFLGPLVWEDFPGAAPRILLPMTLAFNVLVYRSRAAIAWLLLGNLTVFAGLVALRDPPTHPREAAAVNARGVAAIAEMGEGWFGHEQSGQHAWSWAAQHVTIRLEAWPRSGATVELGFHLRAVAPRTVVVRQEGRELARFSVGTALSAHTVPVRIDASRAEVEFATDTPPVRENADPGSRELGFALYDLRLAPPES